MQVSPTFPTRVLTGLALLLLAAALLAVDSVAFAWSTALVLGLAVSRVLTQYSVALARELRLSERRVQAIEYAGFLHDMGKIGLQHNILLKPGALTDSEWEEMKRHPETGAKIVKELHFLKGARDVVLFHHERFDGSGYPQGLAGERIPLEARIVKVADAFDAMLSDRPYRKALSLERAVEQLRQGSGTEFDPRVVGAFVGLVEQGRLDSPSA